MKTLLKDPFVPLIELLIFELGHTIDQVGDLLVAKSSHGFMANDVECERSG